jgi:hypothetical protein
VCRGGPGDRLGNGPPEGQQFACDGHHDQVGVFPSSGQLSVALAPPPLGFPTEILDGFGPLCQAQPELTTDLGRVAVGPGAFAQGPTGMAIARVGDAALMPPLTTGICRRDQPQRTHEWSRVIEPGEASPFCHDRDGHGALAPPQGLEGLDHRGQTPGFALRAEFLFETLQAFGVLITRADVSLEDEVLRGSGTDDFREPPQRGRAPGRSAGLAEILPPPKGVETNLRGVEIPDGLVTGAAQIPAGCILARGEIDGGAIA